MTACWVGDQFGVGSDVAEGDDVSVADGDGVFSALGLVLPPQAVASASTATPAAAVRAHLACMNPLLICGSSRSLPELSLYVRTPRSVLLGT
jgi:hypothetical protein